MSSVIVVALANGNSITMPAGEVRAVETFQRAGKKAASEPAVQFGVRLHLSEPMAFANGTEAMHSQSFVDVLFEHVADRDTYAQQCAFALADDDAEADDEITLN